MQTYYAIRSENYLEHHGIKGMHWGVRRYQNEDGSLTEAGRLRYNYGHSTGVIRTRIKESLGRNVDTKKALERDEVNRYNMLKRNGYTEEEAKREILINRKIKKMLVVSGVIAVGAVAGYMAYTRGKAYTDHIVKAGTKLSNINFGGINNLNDKDAFYNSKGFLDKAKYQHWYWGRKDPTGKGVYQSIIQPNKNIKIAGINSAHKTFEELVKKDPDFKKFVETSVRSMAGHEGWNHQPIGKKTEMDILNGRLTTKNVYKTFNHLLTSGDDYVRQNAKKFYDELQKKGYSGITDFNDRLNSGFRSNSANILFDKTPIYKITNRKVSANELRRNRTIGDLYFQNRDTAKFYGLMGVGAAGSGIYSSHLDRSTREMRVIKKYREEHPNSELSTNEILANYYKERNRQ